MSQDPPDQSPPALFDMRSKRAPTTPEADTQPIKTDWRDFVALTLAVYQLLLGPLLIILAGMLSVYLLFIWLAR